MFSFFSDTHTPRGITLRSHGGAIFIFAVSLFCFVFIFRWLILIAIFQFSSVARSFWYLCDPMYCNMPASLSITNALSLHKLITIELVMPSNHIILCLPLLFCFQSFPESGSFQMSELFASGAKVLEFQLQHQSFQWIFRTDFL